MVGTIINKAFRGLTRRILFCSQLLSLSGARIAKAREIGAVLHQIRIIPPISHLCYIYNFDPTILVSSSTISLQCDNQTFSRPTNKKNVSPSFDFSSFLFFQNHLFPRNPSMALFLTIKSARSIFTLLFFFFL